jgi:N-acetylglucosamine kinase-like BadF-type ATPase
VLITEIYAKKFDIASAAPLVLKAAESNDEQALRIVEEEAEELLLHIGAMYRRVGEEKLPVAFIGGILSNDTLLSRKLRELINEHQPDVTVKQPDHSPAYGAVLMAMSRTT